MVPGSAKHKVLGRLSVRVCPVDAIEWGVVQQALKAGLLGCWKCTASAGRGLQATALSCPEDSLACQSSASSFLRSSIWLSNTLRRVI